MLPESFLWGVSQCGFQFEMGDELRKNIDTRTDWWHWVRDPWNIKNKIVSGDLPENGINNYELYEKDHEIAKGLGLNAYRLGIEWSRIFPCPTTHIQVDYSKDGYGLINEVKVTKDTIDALDEIANHKEVGYYRKVILSLREKGFKVILNLHHFTKPIWIHDPITVRESGLKKGPMGWASEDTIIEFVKFAAYIAHKFGDLVDMWSTFNEPMIVVDRGYLAHNSGFPPGIFNPELAKKVATNLIVAHSRAYDIIKKFDKVKAYKDSKESASVGIINNIIPFYPRNPNDSKDVKATERYDAFYNRMFLEAINNGKLDTQMDGESYVEVKHLKKNDWLGVNYYTRDLVKYKEPKEDSPVIFEKVEGYGRLSKPNSISKDGLPTSDFGWEVYPSGLYDAIFINMEYNKPIYITENGIADAKDVLRPYYIVSHIAEVERAIENGAKVYGYLHWALMDNYEWASGFRMRFGLYEVDLKTKERRPRRRSVQVFKEITQNNGVTEKLRKEFLEN